MFPNKVGSGCVYLGRHAESGVMEIIASDKGFFQANHDIYLISPQHKNVGAHEDMGQYPQYIFLWRNNKNIYMDM